MRLGELRTSQRKGLQNCFESFYRNRLKYFPVITLSKPLQAEKQILSVHGTVMFDDVPDSGIAALKQLFTILFRGRQSKSGELRRYLHAALTSPGDVLRLAYRFYVEKRAGTSAEGPVSIGVQAEHAPDPNSRVTLSEARDCLGMRKTRLDWRVGELERRTLWEFVRTIAAEFERLGMGSFHLGQVAFLDDPLAWVRMVHDSAHHMGTTRMHESPQFGVVDPNCRVHGVDNLYVGSSSVFPTGARSNPTLTMLALCLRMADRFKQLLK